MNPLSWLNARIGDAQRRWPALRRLDDADWKTWCWHTVFAACGAAITHALVGRAWSGAALIAALYILREADQAEPSLPDIIGPVLLFGILVALQV